ncbi:carboxypeptidase-like regulatory domain-containing protein [uncultured Acetobacteroides sp.]|uniref:carboxypeptidase-like regulatory domain-containing protein n=1 Tax=uncultured Acetobacteroides sp. TaxID=1760811 RepID=UPI0029F5183B|nr:carboxypeptidase-like regulatory domain-containing protein [uncultured Acetobacteroides sp.]
MRYLYEQKLTMNLAVIDLLKANKTILDPLPGYLQYWGVLDANVGAIVSTKELLTRNSTGIALNKDLVRGDLVKMTLNVGEMVESYGRLNGNVVLSAKVHFTESKLKKASASTLCDSAMVVYANAMEHAVELEKYGVTPAMLVALNSMIEKFKLMLPVTHATKVNSKMGTAKLQELFAANDDVLKKIDLLLVMVKHTHPEFYRSYTTTRKLPSRATSKITLKTRVCSSTGEGIKGVTLTFTPKMQKLAMGVETTVKPIVKKTADKGICYLKNMHATEYTVTAEKVGHPAVTTSVNVPGDEMVMLTIKMDKN